MINIKPVGVVFREGDEVVLAEGSYQDTLGVFLRLRDDVNWADITERDGSIHSHPVVWLAHATGRAIGRNIETWEGEGGATAGSSRSSAASMTGTPAQVELGRAHQVPG